MTKEYILSIPKTINKNGCWIPYNKPENKGYVRIMIGRKRYILSRLVMCIHYNIDYMNKEIEARHKTGCSRACFNFEHIDPGSPSDNIKDSIRDKTHWQAAKIVCPKCNSEYKIKIYKTGWNKGQIHRWCQTCRSLRERNLKR